MTIGKKRKRWLVLFVIFVLIFVAGSLTMSFIYRLPDISSRTPSYMIDDGQATKLGQQFSGQVAGNPGKSGVYLLPHGRDAFAARALLARLSEKSLDIQYYMYHQDTVGGLLTHEVLEAADRGVRVRMLIDDIYGNKDQDTWVGLDAHPNIEVRMWNPWKRGGGRLIQSIVRVREIDYRMHAKSFTADNQATILGGRNIGDEYFDADVNVAFADIDVLTIGPPVREVSSEFDSYWNAEHAYPVNILVRQGTDQDLSALRSKKDAFFEKQSTSDYVQALKDSDLAKGLKDGSLAFSWAEARVIHDSPLKEDLKKAGKDKLLISQLAPYITGAKKTVDIVSPYFVPGDRATEALCKLSQDGVQVRILTNSLASNDVSAVHAGYSKYRRKLLRCGVRLFELDESLKEREGKMFTWLPGLAKSSLHAKTMVFDGEIMFVGSFNFDQRSLFINNEIGLVFKDPAVARAAAKHFEDNVNKVAFEVSFSREGGRENMHWTGGQGGPDVVMEKEPYATTMQKLTVGIVKWLPIDREL
ncbi:Cardiolipin synthase (EC phosphatidylethanolamine-utilizing, bacterial type ClsC [Olavius algarvensis associated proteobacterium Delta 3]|nr:Cardiolipin synthase (EC phosphatidylethanolamine-utilizing, bacterial type ClsC [Olavius algarvensis associated proteobacterium Delta 3]CAB5100868.1 Cardiolipin synthase (EC phosphatidylethanolamine-utilizing, bacterial type ClsC [Olavius algarvensis associated proteobacterium Delta 3]